MTSTATSAPREATGQPSPSGAFTSILNAAVGSAAAKLEENVGSWTDKLHDYAAGQGSSGGLADQGLDAISEGGGAKQKAATEGVKAGVHGRNPFWAAVKGAWQAGTPVVRAAIVAAVVSVILLLLTSPVLLLVFLLALAIIAAVHKARAAKR